jgi:protein involved in temperature-dependent protein secretion
VNKDLGINELGETVWKRQFQLHHCYTVIKAAKAALLRSVTAKDAKASLFALMAVAGHHQKALSLSYYGGQHDEPTFGFQF